MITSYQLTFQYKKSLTYLRRDLLLTLLSVCVSGLYGVCVCVWKVMHASGSMFSAERDKEACAFQSSAARQPGGQKHVSLVVFKLFRGHQTESSSSV